MVELSQDQLLNLQQNARKLLDELVTSEGIYASASIGWDGPYHAWFGRDSAITADFIFASLEYGGEYGVAEKALEALNNFAAWQGRTNTNATGEEVGKIPHEIRLKFQDINKVQHAAATNEREWFVDPTDGVLKNWDTADATSLWILAILRGHRVLHKSLDPTTEKAVRAGLSWIVSTMAQYNGLVGFIGAGLQEGRIYSGLHNQGWKDTEAVYQTPEGTKAQHPIKDVLVNAEAWAALCDGADYFRETDSQFSSFLQVSADRLKQEFNNVETGFRLRSRLGLAQAIDGAGNRLTQRAVDQGAVLWARTAKGTICVNDETAQDIIHEIMSADMFDERAGVRDYALGTTFSHGTNYHGSPNTFWPFMSGMVARGVEQYGDKDTAKTIMKAYLNAIHTLGTNIEMFVQDVNGNFEPWSHPDPEIGQKSSREQAWTAAAVYYAASYLLRQ